MEEPHKNFIVEKVNIGPFKNDIVTLVIPRSIVNLSDGKDLSFQSTQFPVQPCFPLIIHKVQGQTIKNMLRKWYSSTVSCMLLLDEEKEVKSILKKWQTNVIKSVLC